MLRIAVLADTHLPRGARSLPAAAVEVLRRADVVVHAGDFVSARFLAELESLGRPVFGVAGNVDEPALQARLPRERVVEVAGARIGVVHDAGRHDGRARRLTERFPGCDVVVYGHTHVPELVREGAAWVVNPGSPTERRRAPSRTIVELAVEPGRVAPALIELGP